ncbi:MAG: DUF2092 domain-containing protein [Capsulimonadales bacterium]|nr:DUF2092 domain-containing protein [Capsulimonadales bacterium]
MRNRTVPIVLTAAMTIVLPAAYADEKSDAILKEAMAASARLKSLSADMSVSGPATGQGSKEMTLSGTFRALRPNFIRFSMEMPGQEAMLVVCDGTTLFMQTQSEKTYSKKTAEEGMKNMGPTPFGFFFHPTLEQLNDGKTPPKTTKYIGQETIDGIVTDVIEATGTNTSGGQRVRFYFTPERIMKRVDIFGAPNQTPQMSFTFKNIVTDDAAVTPADFTYTPPAGFRDQAEVMKEQAANPSRGVPDYMKNLVPVGKKAPAFSLPTPKGGTLSLARAMKGRKATIVNFWFYG